MFVDQELTSPRMGAPRAFMSLSCHLPYTKNPKRFTYFLQPYALYPDPYIPNP